MHAYILMVAEMHYKSEENTVTRKILGVFGSRAKALAFAEANNLHNPDNYYRRENDPSTIPATTTKKTTPITTKNKTTPITSTIKTTPCFQFYGLLSMTRRR